MRSDREAESEVGGGSRRVEGLGRSREEGRESNEKSKSNREGRRLSQSSARSEVGSRESELRPSSDERERSKDWIGFDAGTGVVYEIFELKSELQKVSYLYRMRTKVPVATRVQHEAASDVGVRSGRLRSTLVSAEFSRKSLVSEMIEAKKINAPRV